MSAAEINTIIIKDSHFPAAQKSVKICTFDEFDVFTTVPDLGQTAFTISLF